MGTNCEELQKRPYVTKQGGVEVVDEIQSR